MLTPELTKVLGSYVEDVAAVAIELHSRMRDTEDEWWPNGYRYHIFGGFPGWWATCSRVGAVFAELWRTRSAEDWIDKVDKTAVFVWDHIQEHQDRILAEPELLSYEKLREIVTSAMEDHAEVHEEEEDDGTVFEDKVQFYYDLSQAVMDSLNSLPRPTEETD